MNAPSFRNCSLRNSKEFRRVYNTGAKYESELLVVFVRRNDLGRHRLGITVSRKFSSRAVHRNRAKRLLREAFRINAPSLNGLEYFYDWVLNAKRSLMSKNVYATAESFRDVIFRMRQ